MLRLYPINRRSRRRTGLKAGRQEEGFTLIELLVVIAILGIAVSGIYMLFIWGYNTFYRGTEKTELHYQLNTASELITGEVRYAAHLTLLDDWGDLPSGPEEVAPGDHFLFYDQKERAIVLLDQNGSRQIGGPVISSANFSLENGLFYYDLEASKKNSRFRLESTVLLLNTVNPVSPEEPLPAIRYIKPEPS